VLLCSVPIHGRVARSRGEMMLQELGGENNVRNRCEDR
jgi:hypothetical protein